MSPAKIAEELKVARKTVYNRINKLNDGGVIKKYTILLSRGDVKLRAAFIHPLKYLFSHPLGKDVSKLGEEAGKHPDVVLSARVRDKILVVWRDGKFNPRTVENAGRVEELDLSEVYKFIH